MDENKPTMGRVWIKSFQTVGMILWWEKAWYVLRIEKRAVWHNKLNKVKMGIDGGDKVVREQIILESYG